MKKIIALLVTAGIFTTQALAADTAMTPDNISLDGLYNKFKEGTVKSNISQIVTKEFYEATEKSIPPHRIFEYAKKGNMDACNKIGYLFDGGFGVQKSSEKAIKWFSYCANNNAYAAYNLGVIYAEGRGVPKDDAKAEPYFRAAWNGLKIPQAGIRLAYWYRSQKNYTEEWDWLLKLEYEKRYSRHWGYLMGEMIIKKKAPIYDTAKAFRILGYALDEYSAPAARLLAYAYGNGLDSKPSPINACQMDLLAAAFESKHSVDSSQWVSSLDEDEKSRCRELADKWLSLSHRPEQLNFKALIAD